MSKLIELTKGFSAVVDDEDYKMLRDFKWRVQSKPGSDILYAVRTQHNRDGTTRHIRMHRQIMRALPGEEIDHRNRNGLYNCKSNLRFCNTQQNCLNRPKRKDNTSGFIGVNRMKSRWAVNIREKGRSIFFFWGFDIEECAYIRDQVMMQLWPEYVNYNFDWN